MSALIIRPESATALETMRELVRQVGAGARIFAPLHCATSLTDRPSVMVKRSIRMNTEQLDSIRTVKGKVWFDVSPLLRLCVEMPTVDGVAYCADVNEVRKYIGTTSEKIKRKNGKYCYLTGKKNAHYINLQALWGKDIGQFKLGSVASPIPEQLRLEGENND